MARLAYFVDGSNLFGVLKQLDCQVDDYESFYRYLHKLSTVTWAQTCGSNESCALQRVYWYVVGEMDDWSLNDPKAQSKLRSWYEEHDSLKKTYMKLAGEKLGKRGPTKPTSEQVHEEAWSLCFKELRSWYEKRQSSLAGMRRFYHAVRASTDGIDIIECGRWKLDLMNLKSDEKGLDTRLAVDMVALEQNYDVAVVLSGDADMIPSINLMKQRGKHVGVLEFIKGYPPENSGRGFSSHLKLSADFVTAVYEMDLVREKVATKGAPRLEVPGELTNQTLDNSTEDIVIAPETSSFGDGLVIEGGI